MRRPSRQGLLRLCTCGTNYSLAAPLRLITRTKFARSTKHEFLHAPLSPYRLPSIKYLAIRITVIISILAVHIRDGYAQDAASIVSEYFSKVRGGELPALPVDVLKTRSHDTTFSLLQPYLRDSVNIIRAKACEIVHHLALHASQKDIRQHAVDILVRSYREEDPETSSHIVTYLTRYTREDFSMAARDSIRSLIRKEPLYLTQILKLAGFLDLRDLKNEIRPWTQPGNRAEIRWAASLSLARMGDTYAITAIYNRIKKLPVNDDIVYQVFPDLIYTRQQTLYAYMVEALQLKENNCLSADAEREVPRPCGYRIMEQLAPVVVGFPFALGESGDLDTSDYAKALEQVRAWFETNKTYTILNNNY